MKLLFFFLDMRLISVAGPDLGMDTISGPYSVPTVMLQNVSYPPESVLCEPTRSRLIHHLDINHSHL